MTKEVRNRTARPKLSKLLKVALLKWGIDLLPASCVAAWPENKSIPNGWSRQGGYTFFNGKVKSMAIRKEKVREIEVELIETKRTKKLVRIQLPIYREHVVGDNSIIFTRINEDLSAVHITKHLSSFEIEVNKRYYFDGSSIDYHLGRGEHALTEEQFNEVVEELMQFLVGHIGLT